MTLFWSLAATMVAVAFLFVLPPLLRTHKTSSITRNDLNTKVIREQLAELDTDLVSGKLEQSQFDAARKDLERELLYDLDSADHVQTDKPIRSGRWLTLLLIPIIPLSAVLLYQLLGFNELIQPLQQAQGSKPEHNNQSGPAASLDVLVAQLAERMRSAPDDLQGWGMLAKTYTVLHQPDKAIQAYENILRLGGGNSAATLADYADVIVTANHGEFNEQAGKLLQQALELEPQHLKALWLAGHWKYDKQDYAKAVLYWEMAARQLPSGSADATIIAQQISMAQSQLEPGSATPATVTATTTEMPAAKAAIKTSLRIHVELDPELLASATPGDTVFIYARAAKGPRMPLAIVRKQVKDLPVTVTLDDSLAMTPQMVLSNFKQVTIGARVSKSGNAMPQSGDLQGSVSPVNTQATGDIQITINRKVP